MSDGGNSQPTSQTVTQNTIDPAMVPYYTHIAQTAQGLMNEPYSPYAGGKAGARVAPFSADQKTAMSGIMGLQQPGQFGQASDLYTQAGAYTPGTFNAPADYSPERYASQYTANQLSGPERMAALAAPTAFGDYTGLTGVGQAGTFGMDQAQQYMSPFQQNVTDIAVRKAQEEAARQSALGGLRAAQFGGLGASGQAVYNANLGRSLVQDVGDLYAKGQQAAFENAQAQYERDRAARLGYGQTNLQGAMDAYRLNQATQAQNVGQQQAAYGLNLQGTDLNTRNVLNYFQANEAARQAQNAQGLAAFQANAQDRQFAAQQNAAQALAAFQANEQARQFAAQQDIAAAQGLASLGATQQQADLARLGAQMDVGQMRTARQQALKDINYQNYLEGRDWRANRLAQMAGITMGIPTQTASNQIVYSQTPGLLQQFGGTAAGLYGAYRAGQG